jgi:hypothetical protein
MIITYSEFRFVIADQARARGVEAAIIVEPQRRDRGRHRRRRTRRVAPPRASPKPLHPVRRPSSWPVRRFRLDRREVTGFAVHILAESVGWRTSGLT